MHTCTLCLHGPCQGANIAALRWWLGAPSQKGVCVTLPPRFKHQAAVLAATAELDYYAIFWDQGTGKTRLALDTMVEQARRGNIDAALILAPNGVHQMWIEDEVPAWVPGHDALFLFYYTSAKAGTKRHQHQCQAALKAKFPIVAMSYDAIMTKRGRDFARKLLRQRKVYMVCDESTAIKSPGAKRTKTIVAAGRHAACRRILTGTPYDGGPFDIYTQMRFLHPTFWKENGFQTYSEFKTFFGVWRTGTATDATGRVREFPELVCYRNLDKLHELMQQVSSRVVKDTALSLPPKLYQKMRFELTPTQKRVYREIKEEAMTFLQSGELVTVPLALTRLLRLQQVTSGFIPPETGEPEVEIDPGRNPRLDALRQVLAECYHQGIIWARFNREIDQICELLGKDAVQADGRVKAVDRQRAVKAFQAGDVQWLVSKPQTKGMSRGQTLTNARTVIYYSNSFSLEDRNQSEDRAHRSGQQNEVCYVDIIAPGTVDTHIVANLRGKKRISAFLTGDTLKEWL